MARTTTPPSARRAASRRASQPLTAVLPRAGADHRDRVGPDGQRQYLGVRGTQAALCERRARERNRRGCSTRLVRSRRDPRRAARSARTPSITSYRRGSRLGLEPRRDLAASASAILTRPHRRGPPPESFSCRRRCRPSTGASPIAPPLPRPRAGTSPSTSTTARGGRGYRFLLDRADVLVDGGRRDRSRSALLPVERYLPHAPGRPRSG
jgi:hypothetical protein